MAALGHLAHDATAHLVIERRCVSRRSVRVAYGDTEQACLLREASEVARLVGRVAECRFSGEMPPLRRKRHATAGFIRRDQHVGDGCALCPHQTHSQNCQLAIGAGGSQNDIIPRVETVKRRQTVSHGKTGSLARARWLSAVQGIQQTGPSGTLCPQIATLGEG